MELDDIISLAEAADLLGLAPATLRSQASNGAIEARRVGGTWITTKQEVERYRAQNLGRRGRPVSAGAIELTRFAWPSEEQPDRVLRIIGFEDTDPLELERVRLVVEDALVDAEYVRDVKSALREDPLTRDIIVSSGEVPPYIGIAKVG